MNKEERLRGLVFIMIGLGIIVASSGFYFYSTPLDVAGRPVDMAKQYEWVERVRGEVVKRTPRAGHEVKLEYIFWGIIWCVIGFVCFVHGVDIWRKNS